MQYKQLNIEERELIQTRLWNKVSIRSIATELNRSTSTISREIRRNKPPERNLYTPRLAEERARVYRKNRGRKDRLKNKSIRDYTINHLKLRWSPEQISGRIKIDLGEEISHEAIYQFIYRYSKKTGNEDLRKHLRNRRKIRVPHGSRKYQRIFVPKGNSIENRPSIVENRERCGDLESDSIESSNHRPGVNTLTDRKSGYGLITKLKTKDSISTFNAIYSRLKDIPKSLRHTITFDNGPENSKSHLLDKYLKVKTYHAHPYHSWERGSNENYNGLVRDYFPKKTNFDTIADEEIKTVEDLLNNRPRKRLGYRTPLEVWSVALRG